MEPAAFVAFGVVSLGFSAILGVLTSSQWLWKRRRGLVPLVAALHGISIFVAISLAGGSSVAAILVAVVTGLSEIVTLLALGTYVEERQHEWARTNDPG